MKILFVGDYSNLHACLAAELRQRGHDVTVVSDGGRYMRTSADILLARAPGLRGSLRYLYDVGRLWPRLKGYDVVQLINPHFLALRPKRLRPLLQSLRDRNRSIFLTLAGDDHFFVKACAGGKMFRFSEFRIGDRPTEFIRCNPQREKGWLLPEVADYNSMVYDMADGAMSVLPEYDMAARPILGDRLAFTNIPVDLSRLDYTPLKIGNGSPLRFMIGIREGMELQKGTAYMKETMENLASRYPDRFSLDVVRNVSLAEYLQRLRGSHVVLDQLYSYSPATNALQTMALGRVAASGGQPEYYEAIGWTDERPVINLQPGMDIRERLEILAESPDTLCRMSRLGRSLVEKHNDVRIVAARFERHWRNTLDPQPS